MAQFSNNINNNVEENAELEKNLSNSPASDCESGVTGGSSSSAADTAASPPPRRRIIRLFDQSLALQLNPNDGNYKFIENRFIDALTTSLNTAKTPTVNTGGSNANVTEKVNVNVKVVAIHKRNWTNDVVVKARAESFQTHLKALHSKITNGVVNHGAVSPFHYAYFGGSFSNIHQVLSRGFSFSDLIHNPNSAIFLSPDHSPAFSLDEAVEDENGIRHLLLCKVLLGRCELIGPESAQSEPSSEEYDSGIDDYYHPKKFMIWSNNMNTHILPEYVISFTLRTPRPSPPPPPSPPKVNVKERNVERATPMPPSSPWITFPILIAVLSRCLPTDAMALINKYHNQYKEKRISRLQLVNIVRQIAGDRLLKAVIKSCRGVRVLRYQSGFLRNK